MVAIRTIARAGIAVGSWRTSLCALPAKSIVSNWSRLLLLAAPSVPSPTAIPAASSSGTGASPEPPFMLLSGLWVAPMPYRFIRAMSAGVTVMAWWTSIPGPSTPAPSSTVSVVVPCFVRTATSSSGDSWAWIWNGAR